MTTIADVKTLDTLTAELARKIDDIRHTDRDDINRWNRLDAEIKNIKTRIAEINAYLTNAR